MSPRAAWRLERLGHHPVFDYAAGKVDWLAAGLPTVRADPSERRALDGARRHPPTSGPDDLVGDVGASGGAATVVVDPHGIVLGRLRLGSDADATTRVDEVMEPGPATVRAHEPLEPLLDRMARRRVAEVIVTTPEGRLLGVVHRADHRPPSRE